MVLHQKNAYTSRRSPVLADNIVSTSQPLAAQAGLAVLRDGGNAVDAAIAAAAVLTVVEPTGNGIGSDAFCIVWDGERLSGLNASGAAPAGWTPERFAGRTEMPYRGWESVTVPGAISAWRALSERFGTRPLTSLLEPAALYAERGFPVSPIVSELWSRASRILGDQPGFSEAFLPGGRSPLMGERFRNPAQARSLRLIAETGGDAFYRGELAERIVAFARTHNAALSLDDLASHAPEWCGTISQKFGKIELHEIPPNGQGIAALMALGMLDHTEVREFGPDSVEALHLQIEAIKLAFADLQAHVGDGSHMRDATTEDLLDPAYLKRRAALISPYHAGDHRAGAPRAGGTVYLATADASGMMVSYIQSNYAGFGSGVVVPETGISMQNRGAGFTLEVGHPNEVGPRKRPIHTIIPGFVMRNGQPLMSFGVMGGAMQAQGHLQMVLRTQLWGQDAQAAVDAPRWRFIKDREVCVEGSLPHQTAAGLAALGHQIRVENSDGAIEFGGAQLICKLEEGGYIAGSEPRKDGQAVGF